MKDWKGLTVFVAFVGVLGLLIWCMTRVDELEERLTPEGQNLSEPDRPPIIVSDGSIDVYIDRDPNYRVRGSWTFTAGSDSAGDRLRHQFPGGTSKSSRLEAFLLNAQSNTETSCSDAEQPHEVVSLRVVYGPNNPETAMEIALDGGDLQIMLPARSGATEVHRFWRTIGDGNKRLMSATLRRADGTSTVCNFDRSARKRGIITIYQRK